MEVAEFQEGFTSTRACSQQSCTCQAGFHPCPVPSVASLAGCLARWASEVQELQMHSGPEPPRESDPGQPDRGQQVCLKKRSSLTSARPAQPVPKLRIAPGLSKESNFILWGISEVLNFIPHLNLKKKCLEKKIAFEIINPISLLGQINKLHPKK